MKKQNERDEYFYALGHAVAIADMYTLIASTREDQRHAKIMEWMNSLKELYEQKDLWREAQNQIEGE